MKGKIIWAVTPCTSLEVHRLFGRNVSPASSVSKSKQSKKTATCAVRPACRLFIPGFLFGLLFDHEEGGDSFLRKIGGLLPKYTGL
jgi:hypothetical protein